MSGPVTHYFNNSSNQNTSRYAQPDTYSASQASYRQDMPNREHHNLSSMEFQKLAENRSLYGSYLDNALALDPHKEKKSMYDIVYTQDIYDPWGKPGGGAPQVDNSTGRLKTKITGTMQWNLDGKTPSARSKKLQTTPLRPQPNLVEFRKTPNSIVKLPLPNEATTYRQVFGGIDNNNYPNGPLSNRQTPQSSINDPTFLEKQAEVREAKRRMQSGENNVNNSYFHDQNHSSKTYYSNNSNTPPPHQQQPKTNAKFVDSSPAVWTKMWFGRPGGGAPTFDARRRNLTEQLENRNNSNSLHSSRRGDFDPSLQNSLSYRSSHRNLYDGQY